MDTATVAAAVKELTKAEKKVTTLQSGRDAFIAAATKAATEKIDGKIGEASTAAQTAKTTVQNLLK